MGVTDVLVRFRADIGDFTSKTQAMAASVDKAKGEVGEFTTGVSKTAQDSSKHWGRLSAGALAAGAAIGVGIGLAVKAYADFDQAMSNVAATGPEAAGRIEELSAKALEAGARTQYSATEAAAGLEELMKAGLSVDQAMAGLDGALDLAASGGIGVADAAQTAAVTLKQFGLEGQQAGHVADLLAAGANEAVGGVDDMAAALKMSGTVAHQYGVSIEETVGSLAMFADQALIGSDAGTSMKQMLLQLASPTNQAQAALDKYNISAYDSQGNFVGMANLADQLKNNLGGLSQAQQNAALKTIFGADAIRAATILMNGGGDAVRKYTSAVDQFGYAGDMAGKRMDNLKGDLENLSGSVETALIKMGASADGPLRGVVQSVTEVVNVLGNMPPAAQSVVGAFAALSSGGLLLAGGLGKAVQFVNETKTSLQALSISGKTAGLALGGIGVVLGVAAAAIGYFAQQSADARGRVEDFTSALQLQGAAAEKAAAQVAAKQLQEAGALDAARQLGISTELVTQATLGNADAQAKVSAAMRAATDSAGMAVDQFVHPYARGMVEITAGANDTAHAVDVLRGGMGKSSEAFAEAKARAAEVAQATGQVGQAASTAAGGVGQTGKAMEDAAASSNDAAEALGKYQNALLQISGGQIGMEAAIDAATSALKENKRNLDLNTEGGRANMTALNNVAASTQKYVQSLRESGASVSTVAGAAARGRQAFLDTAAAMGMSAGEANKMADAYFGIPESVQTDVSAVGASGAANVLDELLGSANAVDGKRVTVSVGTQGYGLAMAELLRLNGAAVSADGKSVTIPASTPGAKPAKFSIDQLRNASISADGKSVSIPASAPGAAPTRVSLQSLGNVAVSADRKSVSIDTRAPGAAGARNAILQALAAAVNKTHTITTRRVTQLVNIQKAVAGGGFVGNAPLAKMAGGGFYGRVSGEGSWTSDSVGPVMLSDDEFVVRAARAVLLERTYPGLLDLLNGHGPLPKFTGLADGGRPTFASPARYTAPPRAGGVADQIIRVPKPEVRVYIGDRELTDLVDVRVAYHDSVTDNNVRLQGVLA